MAPLFLGLGAVTWAAALVVKPNAQGEVPGGAVQAQLPDGAAVVDDPKGRFRVAFVDEGEVRLWLLPNEALDIPDLLVYGGGEGEPLDIVGAGLPPGAVLLGPASPETVTSWRVSEVPRTLLLFSLGHQAVAAAIELRRD